MKSRKKLVMAFLCLAMNASAQNIKTLSIGDSVPDITLNHIINYKTSSAKLSDFGNKPIIIDFFSTWCSSCIAALPNLDNLKKKFGENIQIFVVTHEKQKVLQTFLQKNKIAKDVTLAFITDDTILNQLFPHKMIPHEIIIYNKSVKAVTYPEYITERNMTKLLANTTIDIPQKKDLLALDMGLALEKNAKIDTALITHSILTNYIEGFGFKIRFSEKNNLKRHAFTNVPIVLLYQMATNFTNPAIQNRVILDVNDKSKFIMPTKADKGEKGHNWATFNNYCYELTCSINTSDSAMEKMMLQDLNRSLNLNGRVEKRKIKCLKLILSSPKDTTLLKSKGGKPKIKIDKEEKIKKIQNYPMSALIDAINSTAIPNELLPIVLDRTGYKGNIDLSFQIDDIQNLPSLSIALARYGLKIVPTETYLDMLIISDK